MYEQLTRVVRPIHLRLKNVQYVEAIFITFGTAHEPTLEIKTTAQEFI